MTCGCIILRHRRGCNCEAINQLPITALESTFNRHPSFLSPVGMPRVHMTCRVDFCTCLVEQQTVRE